MARTRPRVSPDRHTMFGRVAGLIPPTFAFDLCPAPVEIVISRTSQRRRGSRCDPSRASTLRSRPAPYESSDDVGDAIRADTRSPSSRDIEHEARVPRIAAASS